MDCLAERTDDFWRISRRRCPSGQRRLFVPESVPQVSFRVPQPFQQHVRRWVHAQEFRAFERLEVVATEVGLPPCKGLRLPCKGPRPPCKRLRSPRKGHCPPCNEPGQPAKDDVRSATTTVTRAKTAVTRAKTTVQPATTPAVLQTTPVQLQTTPSVLQTRPSPLQSSVDQGVTPIASTSAGIPRLDL